MDGDSLVWSASVAIKKAYIRDKENYAPEKLGQRCYTVQNQARTIRKMTLSSLCVSLCSAASNRSVRVTVGEYIVSTVLRHPVHLGLIMRLRGTTLRASTSDRQHSPLTITPVRKVLYHFEVD